MLPARIPQRAFVLRISVRAPRIASPVIRIAPVLWDARNNINMLREARTKVRASSFIARACLIR
jgi:hypothetical protein